MKRFDFCLFVQPLKECRYGGAMAYFNNNIYVVGGILRGAACSWVSRINITDARPVWTRLQSMPRARRLHACAVLNGKHGFGKTSLKKKRVKIIAWEITVKSMIFGFIEACLR